MLNSTNQTVSNEAQKPFNLSEWRERFIINLLRISCLLGVIFIVGSSFNDRVLYISLYVGLLAITFIPTPFFIRAYTSIGIIIVTGLNSALGWGPWGDASLFFLISIFLGAILFDHYADIAIFVLTTLFMSVIAVLEITHVYQLQAINAPPPTVISWLASIADFFAIGMLLVVSTAQFKKVFIQSIQTIQDSFIELSESATERAELQTKVLERTEDLELRMTQLRNSTLMARNIAEKQSVAEVIETTAQSISEKFGYYHVGLFILDEQSKIAFLQASSSATGKLLIGQGFRVEPDRKNPLATAIEQNRAIISTDIDQKNFVKDENFPITRSRLVLPLAVRGEVIGLLDLHSDQARAFNLGDAEILQTLADLTAISLDNIRLINETQNLVNQLETDTSIQTQRTWSKLTSRQKPSYQYTPAGVRPVFFRDNQIDADGLRVPLTLHGQNIGSIKLKRKNTDANWSEREKVLIEKIADQVALALENSRLVDEAQKNAAREQMIANISTRIRETLDIDAVARTAVSELQRVFDLKEAEIMIGSPSLNETTQ
jgi:GAF domain-containing protein